MFRKNMRSLFVISFLLIVVFIAGCGGTETGGGAKRLVGLGTEDTVKTFFDAAKNNRMDEAGLYVSAASRTNAQTVLKFMTGQNGMDQIKNSNILSIKQIASQGNYAAVVITVQEANSIKITIKPVGLEKVNGEWYIIDFDQIYADAKYKVLQQLLSSL